MNSPHRTGTAESVSIFIGLEGLIRNKWAVVLIIVLRLPCSSFGEAERTTDTCWQAGVVELTAAQTKAQLRYAAPINGPALWRQMRIENAILVFKIRTDENGSVDCVRVISGHPIMFAAVIDSLRNWKFQPKYVDRRRRRIYGTLIVSTSCCTRGMEAKVLDREPSQRK